MDALLVRIAERITSGADPLLSPSEALELARLPESATLDILSVAGLARAARKPAAYYSQFIHPFFYPLSSALWGTPNSYSIFCRERRL